MLPWVPEAFVTFPAHAIFIVSTYIPLMIHKSMQEKSLVPRVNHAMLFLLGNLVFNIFRGPIELIMGVVFGCLVGVLCWFLPNKDEVQ